MRVVIILDFYKIPYAIDISHIMNGWSALPYIVAIHKAQTKGELWVDI